jgi:hypothetical protein
MCFLVVGFDDGVFHFSSASVILMDTSFAVVLLHKPPVTFLFAVVTGPGIRMSKTIY